MNAPIGKTDFYDLLSSMENGDEIGLLSHLTEDRTKLNRGYNSLEFHRLSKNEGRFYIEGAFLPSAYPETKESMLQILKKFEALLIGYDRVLLRQDPLDFANYNFRTVIGQTSPAHRYRNWISVHMIGSGPFVLGSFSDVDWLAENSYAKIPKEVAIQIAEKARELMRKEHVFGVDPSETKPLTSNKEISDMLKKTDNTINPIDRLIYVQEWHPVLVERIESQCVSLGLEGEDKLAYFQTAADNQNLSVIRDGDMKLDAAFAAAFGFISKSEMDLFMCEFVADINGDIQINIEPNADQHRGGFEWTVSNGENILDSGLAPTEENASTEAQAAKQAHTIKGYGNKTINKAIKIDSIHAAWNTGLAYSEHNQRISAQLLSDGHVAFFDIDRCIDGVTKEIYHGEVIGEKEVVPVKLAQFVMKEYDAGRYNRGLFALEKDKGSFEQLRAFANKLKDAAKAIGADGNPISMAPEEPTVHAVTYECIGFTDDRTVCDREMSEHEALAFSEVAIAEKTLPTFVRGVVGARISEDDGQGNDSIKVFVMVTLLIEADEETIEKQFKPPSHLLSRIADVMIGEDGNCPIAMEDSWHVLEIEETVLPDQLRLNKIPIERAPVKLSDNSPTP